MRQTTTTGQGELAVHGPSPVPAGRILEAERLLEEFLAERDIRQTSKAAYRKALERFFSWLEKNGRPQPDIKDVIQFKTFLLESGLAATSVNSYLSAVRAFFTWAEARRLYPNIAAGVKRIRIDSGFLRDAPTPSQVRAIVDAIDGAGIRGLRDRAIIELMARVGCRDVEIMRADLGDIRQHDAAQVLYYQGKGRSAKDKFKVLTTATLEAIRAYLQARGPIRQGEPLFVSHGDRNPGGRLTTRTISGVVKAAMRRVGIDSPRLSAHSLRHFAATAALGNGASLLAVRDMLGHASVQTTEIYLHSTNRIRDAAENFVSF